MITAATARLTWKVPRGEPDREVVDAQRRPGGQQPPGPLATRRGEVLVLAAVRAAGGLDQGVQAGGDQ
jgi:hypothetical protein